MKNYFITVYENDNNLDDVTITRYYDLKSLFCAIEELHRENRKFVVDESETVLDLS